MQLVGFWFVKLNVDVSAQIDLENLAIGDSWLFGFSENWSVYYSQNGSAYNF